MLYFVVGCVVAGVLGERKGAEAKIVAAHLVLLTRVLGSLPLDIHVLDALTFRNISFPLKLRVGALMLTKTSSPLRTSQPRSCF